VPGAASSFQRSSIPPSAIISDGIAIVRLFAVTTLQIGETYHLPPIGSIGARSIVATHDDTISLSGLLVGDSRYTLKLALETLAESSKRGGTKLLGFGPKLNGLVLITAMTIRTDMQVQSLSFSVSNTRRDVIEVNMSLVYMPLPSALGKLLDLSTIDVAALADMGGS
jgi:hypothetical protein